MPLLLYTYIATEILAPFFGSLVILNAILFLGRMVPLMNNLLGFGIGGPDFLRLCVFMLPKLLIFTVPMASMMAVVVAITRMVNDNEIMALKASGIGLSRLLPPVAIIGAATALLTLYAATTLVPWGTRATQRLFLHLAKEKLDRGIQPRQFSEGLGKVVLYVDQVNPDTNEWRGVYLSDLRHGDTPLTIVARSGRIVPRLQEMQIDVSLVDGTLNRAQDGITQAISFARYQLTLPIAIPTNIGGTSLAEANKNALTQRQLLEQAVQRGAATQEGIGLLIEHQLRQALPVGCLLLSLLGLPLAMLARPGRRPPGIPLALLCFIGYYVLFTAGKAMVESGRLPLSLGMWGPNLILAALTALLIRQAASEIPSATLDRLAGLWQGLLSMLPGRRAPEAEQ
ncbi:MAG: LptF/LptG family permease [Thermodesulfobacteriota bacterium]